MMTFLTTFAIIGFIKVYKIKSTFSTKFDVIYIIAFQKFLVYQFRFF